jgi:hypothetical protein
MKDVALEIRRGIGHSAAECNHISVFKLQLLSIRFTEIVCLFVCPGPITLPQSSLNLASLDFLLQVLMSGQTYRTEINREEKLLHPTDPASYTQEHSLMIE